MKPKITKYAAMYVEKAPDPPRPCKACSMFREPHSCTLVEGHIYPEGHCMYWEHKT